MERREELLRLLREGGVVTGTDLASRLMVSRQVIVQDIALLRAGGSEITATPGGYTLSDKRDGNIITIACRHSGFDSMRDELYAIVDNGAKAHDVIVEHGVYGQITAMLSIGSRYEADTLIKNLKTANAEPLSALTQGVHLHTVAVPDMGAAERVTLELKRLGILINEND